MILVTGTQRNLVQCLHAPTAEVRHGPRTVVVHCFDVGYQHDTLSFPISDSLPLRIRHLLGSSSIRSASDRAFPHHTNRSEEEEARKRVERREEEEEKRRGGDMGSGDCSRYAYAEGLLDCNVILLTVGCVVVIFVFAFVLYLFAILWHDRRRVASDSPADHDTSVVLRRGLDPKILDSIPVVVHRASAGSTTECAVCLSEIAVGEKLRVVPKCKHCWNKCPSMEKISPSHLSMVTK